MTPAQGGCRANRTVNPDARLRGPSLRLQEEGWLSSIPEGCLLTGTMVARRGEVVNVRLGVTYPIAGSGNKGKKFVTKKARIVKKVSG